MDGRLANSVANGGVPTYAWGFVVLGGLIWLAYGIVFSTGADSVFQNGPASAYSAQATNDLTNASRLVGVLTGAGGILLTALGSRSFRRGERWAWYTVATVPITGVIVTYIVFLDHGGFTPTVWVTFPSFGLLPLLGVLGSIRSFFPKKKMATH